MRSEHVLLARCQLRSTCLAPLQGEVVDRALQYDDARPQAICAFLAASAAAQAPLLVDLTDGEVHHLLRLEGNELFVYEDCGPQQVSMQAFHQVVSVSIHADGRPMALRILAA